jgi:phage terminase large subunit
MEIKLTAYQDEFVFGDGKYKFLKSAWGTGKTLALIVASMNESETYPNNLGVIFRKEYIDLRDSTCKDFESYTGLKISSSRDVVLPNKSVIMFRHLEELNNIQNMNLGWFGIEQGEELETDDHFFTLFGRLRRQNSGLKGYVISNAKGRNWIWKIKQKGLFDDKTRKRLDKHLSATTFDNAKNLSKEFISSLEILKTNKPQLYNRFVLNSDDDEDTVDIIIPPALVRKAVNKKIKKSYPIYRIVVCDPARYGDDETVCYVMEKSDKSYQLIDKEIYNQKSTMETAGRLVRLLNKHKCNAIAVDVCGLGAGVADRLEELGENVIEINSAHASKNKDKYRNIRAEIWAKAADKFENDLVSVEDDEGLIEQLSLVKYKTIESNGRLQVQPKDEIKKVLGRSPDRADAFVMGLWALDKSDPIEDSLYQPKIKKFNQTFNSATV